MKKIAIVACMLLSGAALFAQQPADSTLKDVGVAVTPAHLNYNVKPGQTKTFEVKVSNETTVKRSFNVSLKDYDADKAGKTIFMEPGTAMFGMSRWLNVSPTFFELKPGAVQKIRVTLTVPDSAFANRAAWGLLWIEEKKEREALDTKGDDKKISLGVIPTFAFGVYLYQNPPSVANNKVEIQNFAYQTTNDKQRKIEMNLKNVGDGIASCVAYVELTNTSTGKTDKLTVKRFTILPGYVRNYVYTLPAKLDKGKYSAVGVLDYGSKEEVEAAETTFTIE